MKKLAITSVAVLIALIGFTAILVCLPCGDGFCAVEDSHNGCEMHNGKSSCAEASGDKCSGEKGTCGHEGKSSCGSEEKCSHNSEGCGKGQGHHDGCGGGHEKCSMKEWTDADGKCHKEVKVTVGGEGCGAHQFEGKGCPMEMGDHNGCCGCCMMKHGGGMNCMMDSAGSDSVRVRVRVRGKL